MSWWRTQSKKIKSENVRSDVKCERGWDSPIYKSTNHIYIPHIGSVSVFDSQQTLSSDDIQSIPHSAYGTPIGIPMENLHRISMETWQRNENRTSNRHNHRETAMNWIKIKKIVTPCASYGKVNFIGSRCKTCDHIARYCDNLTAIYFKKKCYGIRICWGIEERKKEMQTFDIWVHTRSGIQRCAVIAALPAVRLISAPIFLKLLLTSFTVNLFSPQQIRIP